VNTTNGRRIDSGLLDTLVERIARTTESSAVFVTAESPVTGVSLLAEFPASASCPSRSSYAAGLAAGDLWADGQVIAVPIRGTGVTGWAVAVGPCPGHVREAEELVALLARCAAVMLDPRPGHECREETTPRWEDAARDGYWEWDIATGVMRFSRRSLALLDHRHTDRPTRPEAWLDRIHPDDRAGVYVALLTAAIETGPPFDHEHRVVRRDGSVSRLVMRAVSEYDSNGQPLRLIGWLCDVSRARQVETDLRTAQSLADIGRVAASAAHDFNNFLTIIRGHTELALGLVKPDSPVAESLELIKYASAGATTLTKQLLTVRRRHTPVHTVVDLNEVIAGMERTLRSVVGAKSELVTTLRPNAGPVPADAVQIHRLLINLVVNARDAMPQGGLVTIETDTMSADAFGVPAKPLLLPDGEYVTLTVRDTGAGMDDTTRSRIFEPFFTTKPSGEGTGLGLWIVRDITERSGGVVDVRSTPGAGSEFVMYFPRADQVLDN
jgi:signal transduction histidine kinase